MLLGLKVLRQDAGDDMAHPNHYEDDNVLVRKMIVGVRDNNCYWFACKKTGHATLIDASADPDVIISAASDLEPLRILITHGHFDHIEALADLQARLGVPAGIHSGDAESLTVGPDFTIEEGQKFVVGEAELTAMHTPGHTPGGTCFTWGSLLFSGDTLFPGGPGNTWGSNEKFVEIMNSIDKKLFPLGDDVLVMPGHGLDTTIGTERPHFDEWLLRGW